jgi:hypothetical protein
VRAPALILLLLAAAPALGAVPPDLEAAQVAAEAAYGAGDYRGSARLSREILADLDRRPSAEATESAWRRALLQLALAEGTLGNGPAAKGAMERVLAFDPAAELDPELFSPAFRREFEAARERVAALPRFQLLVTTRSGKGRAFVQGRPAGEVPAEAMLPKGSYRVGVEQGGVERTLTVELARNESIVMDVVPQVALAARPPPEAAVTAVSQGNGWVRPAAWTTTGLAVAAAGVATWQGVAAAGSQADAKGMLLPDGSLKPGVDPAAYAAQVTAYQSERTAAWIAAGSAVALGVGATVLWLLVPSAAVEPAPGGVALRF